LSGNALLIYYVIVTLGLHISWFDVCWSFGVVIQQNSPKLLMMDILMYETC